MPNEIKDTQTEIAEVSTAVAPYENATLNQESLELLDKIIASSDEKQTQDLTYLFNLNQNKKTLVRMDKLSGLQDGLVDQFVKRIQERPDEISNKELMDGLRIVQDIIERGQRQVSGVDQQPLIQFNQQNNSVNIGSDTMTDLNRESRDRVKNAVLGLLSGLNTNANAITPVEIIEEEPKNDN